MEKNILDVRKHTAKQKSNEREEMHPSEGQIKECIFTENRNLWRLSEPGEQ